MIYYVEYWILSFMYIHVTFGRSCRRPRRQDPSLHPDPDCRLRGVAACKLAAVESWSPARCRFLRTHRCVPAQGLWQSFFVGRTTLLASCKALADNEALYRLPIGLKLFFQETARALRVMSNPLEFPSLLGGADAKKKAGHLL